MYYAEELINGKWYYKTHPKEAWKLMSYNELKQLYDNSQL